MLENDCVQCLVANNGKIQVIEIDQYELFDFLRSKYPNIDPSNTVTMNISKPEDRLEYPCQLMDLDADGKEIPFKGKLAVGLVHPNSKIVITIGT